MTPSRTVPTMEDGGCDRFGAADSIPLLHLKSAFFAMEPLNHLISLARQAGGGTLTPMVQTFILEKCLTDAEGRGAAGNHKYLKNALQKFIVASESIGDVVEGLYEKLAHYLTLQLDDCSLEESNRVCRYISFLPSPCSKSLTSLDFAVSLQCSLNMLEGDTGCALWPSSLFLSEVILSYPEMFANKFCFEVGSGIGLVGITLIHVGASKVLLTDGDMSSLENMKINLELNHSPATMASERYSKRQKLFECKHLQWESANEYELQDYQPEIVLGADIIYDPLCIPHLVRVLSLLLKPKKTNFSEDDMLLKGETEVPVAYIATVIRNSKTFDYFLGVAADNDLSVTDVTETLKPLNLLPYMSSYDRSSVHLLRAKLSCN